MYMLELAATKAKRLCEQGNSVALLVNDLFAVARAYNACVLEHIDSGFMGLDMSAVIAVKKLLAVGRNTEEGGSVTFVACINNDVDEYYEVVKPIKSENVKIAYNTYDIDILSFNDNQ